MLKTLAVAIFSLVLLAACGGVPAANPEPSPTEPPAEHLADLTPPEELPPHLLRVTPEHGEVAGLDLRLCATFDVTDEGMPHWEGPIWFEIAGAEEERPANAVDRREDTRERSGCASTLRHLLQEGELDEAPPVGALELGVRYRDREGTEHRYVWQVRFSLDAPEAPEEVLRIREVYGLLENIDADRDRREQTIAGYYLKDDVLEIYLHDGADAETARREAEAALGDAMPSGGIRVLQLDSPPGGGLLESWIAEAREPVWGMREDPRGGLKGIQIHGSSGGCCNIWNRHTFDVATLYSAHLIREAIAMTSVPQEGVAVFLQPPWRLKEEEAANGIRATLDMPSTARHGEAIGVDVVWTNEGSSTTSLVYAAAVPVNVMVFTFEGEAVWASHSGGAIALLPGGVELAPGEEARHTRYWELVDADGFALPPGDYLVQAQTHIDPHTSLVSDAYALRIEP